MSYKAGIIESIQELKDRTGSSMIAIKKLMQEKLPKDKKWMNNTFLTSLKKGVADGDFVKIKNSYKLSADFKKALKKPTAPKKKAVAPKKAAPKKKVATKKTTSVKKVSVNCWSCSTSISILNHKWRCLRPIYRITNQPTNQPTNQLIDTHLQMRHRRLRPRRRRHP